MAFVDDPNKKQQQNTMNTLQPGASDIQSQQAPTSGSSQPQSSGSGGTIQSAPSPRQQQKPASSGTFTNLQQYSQANQGGAQRMTQAATQNVAQQGKQVQQQAQQQAAKTQSDIAANEAKIAQEQAFARDVIGRAGQADVADSDYERFRSAVTGQTQFNDVRDLDLSKQMVQSQKLQQQAQAAGTDAGRMDILRQTLGKGREYTRGQTNLDAALVARDEQARQGLQQGIQQAAQQTQQALQQTSGDVSARRQALQRLNQQFGSDIMSEGEQATSGVMDAVNQGMMSAQEARQQLAAQLGITEKQAEDQMRALSAKTSGMANYMHTDAGMRVAGLKDISGQANTFYDQEAEALALAGLDPTKVDTSGLGGEITVRGGIGSRKRSSTINLDRNYVWDVGGASDPFNRVRSGLTGATSALTKEGVGAEALARQLGMSGADVSGLQGGVNELYANLKAGQDITAQTAATREQAQRYQALQDLLKGRGIGERTLSLDQAGKAAEQQALLEQARAEAMRKLRIQG